MAPWRDAFPLKGKYLIFHLSGATEGITKLPTKLDKACLIGLLLQALTTKITRNLGKTQPGLLETVCWNTLKHTQSESDSQKRLKVIWVAFLLEISQQTYELTVMSISSTGAKRCASSLISRSTSWYSLAKFQESTCKCIKAEAEKSIQTTFSFLMFDLFQGFPKFLFLCCLVTDDFNYQVTQSIVRVPLWYAGISDEPPPLRSISKLRFASQKVCERNYNIHDGWPINRWITINQKTCVEFMGS